MTTAKKSTESTTAKAAAAKKASGVTAKKTSAAAAKKASAAAAKKTSAAAVKKASAAAAKEASAATAKKKPAGASASRRKSWAAKRDRPMTPEVKDDPRGGTLLIPTPLLVEAEVRTVPRGRVITLDVIRDRLARRFGADRTCPLCTGIFLNIVAGAAEEESGDPRAMAPYWRVVRDHGGLLEKLPLGFERQAELLALEGVEVERRWKVPRLRDLAGSRVE
ncbi:MAG TPA: MGMT family protein [Nannocystaceae bacterium]|nr:MGMT family protein [Nannocystaceae bacterium]